jgi:hypothetical protein
MMSSQSDMDALISNDEEPIRLVGVDQVREALTAERDLLVSLIAVTREAAAGYAPPVSDFIERYWLIPLEQDRVATEQWLDDLESDQALVRDAAGEELELARHCRRLANELATQSPGRETLQVALASYDADFRTEAEGKRSILEAL